MEYLDAVYFTHNTAEKSGQSSVHFSLNAHYFTMWMNMSSVILAIVPYFLMLLAVCQIH